MLNVKFAAVAALFLTCFLEQATSQGCFRSFLRILELEDKVVNTAIRRTYTLCAGTTFRPTFLKGNSFTDNGYPLAVKSNSYIKCGASGSSSNKCVIEGTGSYGIFIESGLFGEDNIGPVLLQGITLDFWDKNGQIAVVIAVFGGQVTFLDCIFRNSVADPIFFIDQYVIDQFSRRSLELPSSNNETEITDAHWNFNYYPGPKESPFTRRLNHDFTYSNPDNSTFAPVSSNRELQLSTSKLTVIFRECQFLFNSPVKVAVNQNGLSVIRFRARNPVYVAVNDPSKFREYVGTLDARFIDCVFEDNNFAFSGDPAMYRSIIDFNSKGSLQLTSNCFINSPVKKFGTVTVQNTATLTNVNNFLSNDQTNLKCPFIARVSSDYDFIRCGPNALKKTCTLRRVSKPSSITFCFPGEATCQVQGQGEVPMKNLKLGDRVLVANNKYEAVYSFGHHSTEITAEYIQLITQATKLELSKDHMVFLDGGRAVPASYVKVGDKLEGASESSSTVTAIRDVVIRQGAYAPFTPSGTLIVNNIKSSSFIAFQQSATLKIGGFDTGVTYQFLAHTFEAPHRFWCQYISACRTEHYTNDGVSTWVAYPHNVAIWYLDQNPIVMSILAVPSVMIVSVFAFPVLFFCFLMTLMVVTHPCFNFRTKSISREP